MTKHQNTKIIFCSYLDQLKTKPNKKGDTLMVSPTFQIVGEIVPVGKRCFFSSSKKSSWDHLRPKSFPHWCHHDVPQDHTMVSPKITPWCLPKTQDGVFQDHKMVSPETTQAVTPLSPAPSSSRWMLSALSIQHQDQDVDFHDCCPNFFSRCKEQY